MWRDEDVEGLLAATRPPELREGLRDLVIRVAEERAKPVLPAAVKWALAAAALAALALNVLAGARERRALAAFGAPPRIEAPKGPSATLAAGIGPTEDVGGVARVMARAALRRAPLDVSRRACLVNRLLEGPENGI